MKVFLLVFKMHERAHMSQQMQCYPSLMSLKFYIRKISLAIKYEHIKVYEALYIDGEKAN